MCLVDKFIRWFTDSSYKQLIVFKENAQIWLSQVLVYDNLLLSWYSKLHVFAVWLKQDIWLFLQIHFCNKAWFCKVKKNRKQWKCLHLLFKCLVLFRSMWQKTQRQRIVTLENSYRLYFSLGGNCTAAFKHKPLRRETARWFHCKMISNSLPKFHRGLFLLDINTVLCLRSSPGDSHTNSRETQQLLNISFNWLLAFQTARWSQFLSLCWFSLNFLQVSFYSVKQRQVVKLKLLPRLWHHRSPVSVVNIKCV